MVVPPSRNILMEPLLPNGTFFDSNLDKGKSILSDQRAKKWELYAGAEDGYLDADMETQTGSQENLPLALSRPTTELHRPGKAS